MFEQQDEKKVEFLELIYDLIFVYLIGRNNSLLHHLDGGFISADAFFTYVLCSLAVIQIWSFSTIYINMYGRNGKRDHVFLFINMYLLYHMADGIHSGWRESVDQFCISWFLILVNIASQHVLEMRNHPDGPEERQQLQRKSMIVFGEAVLVLIHLAVFHYTGRSIAYVPVVFGIVTTLLPAIDNGKVPVDFGHLSERAMLYVVFTFGEMIISITEYFSDKVTLNSLYFSGMAFLIVVGLFLSYEVLYDKIVDREARTSGTVYMLIHVFMIFALNNISVALEFMRMEEVALLPKTLFITASFVLYFIFLFLACRYARKRCAFTRRLYGLIILLGISFLFVMLALRTHMMLNIAVSVIYMFVIFVIMYRRGKLA